jgi:hypothetical protein
MRILVILPDTPTGDGYSAACRVQEVPDNARLVKGPGG